MTRSFCGYQNYVFDLYGTLIDIHTDETAPKLWRFMADWYAVYGADWTPRAMFRRYRQMYRQEELLLKKATGVGIPEIKLEKVFARLLTEAEKTHPAALAPKDGAGLAAWADVTANAFRVRSREWLRLFPGTLDLLSGLKARGKRVYLLSNAQAVFTRPEIEQCGLMDAFDDLWLSSDHDVKKPEPSFLADLMRAHRMAPEGTVMIGNDWHDDMGIACANHVAGVCVNSYRLTARQRHDRREELARRFSEADAERISDVKSIKELAERLD